LEKGGKKGLGKGREWEEQFQKSSPAVSGNSVLHLIFGAEIGPKTGKPKTNNSGEGEGLDSIRIQEAAERDFKVFEKRLNSR